MLTTGDKKAYGIDGLILVVVAAKAKMEMKT